MLSCQGSPDESAIISEHNEKADQNMAYLRMCPASATVRFNEDFTVHQEGTLSAGGIVAIEYALDRLSTCRGTRMGHEAWGITGYYQVDDREIKTVSVATAGVAAEVRIEIPAGKNLALWFTNTDTYGCQAFDSDYGQNFHFSIEDAGPPPATIRFQGDGSFDLQGSLQECSRVKIQYDWNRLTECRGETNGNPAWGITIHYSLDGAEASQTAMTTLRGGELADLEPVITIPRGQDLALWFTISNRWGCLATDSNRGGNYHFAIGGAQ